MADALPEPLVPPECDCTDLDGFMLNVERLMVSELVALSSHEIIGAAVFLWCRAWKQRPAASLPDDERVLAAYARLPLRRFRKIRDKVMRGFVKCSDGRFYHRVLTAEALKAYEKKLSFKNKRNEDAKRLRKWRETRSETRFVAEGQGQGQGQGHKDKKESPPVAVTESGTAREPASEKSGGRSTPIEPTWQPSDSAIGQLRTSRPDLDDATIARRTVEFHAWCAASAKTTFNPDATWLGFMVKTHAQPDQASRRNANGSTPTVADGIAAAYARRSVPPRG